MKLVFVSNYFNHHQKPLSDAFAGYPNVEYTFIETKAISEERLKLGWGYDKKPSYVKTEYLDEQSRAECQRLIDEADVVIFGGAPYSLLKRRLRAKKPVFLYRERIYRTGFSYYKLPFRAILHYFMYVRHKNLHLLCASAYTSADFAKTGCFLKKAYKWGYFTELKKFDDIESLIASKQNNSILWVARFLSLKHPEIPVEIAKRLKNEGYSFEMNLIGNGVMMDQIEKMIREYELEDCVHLLGSMSPEDVRSHMENSEVFLFTSDKNEGWGAVVNESMNSGCAVVASHAIGSVPFLIENEQNGLIYRDGRIDDAYNKVKWLLDHTGERMRIARNAYTTMEKEWNAAVAAKKFMVLANRLLQGEKVIPYSEGVCSTAERLPDQWIDKQ